MSKFDTIELWEERYGSAEEVYDYTGRKMLKSAIGNPNSRFHPTQDHIRPLSQGGLDIKGNIEICHRDTNEEKGDKFSCWTIDGKAYQAKRVKGKRGEYCIEKQ